MIAGYIPIKSSQKSPLNWSLGRSTTTYSHPWKDMKSISGMLVRKSVFFIFCQVSNLFPSFLGFPYMILTSFLHRADRPKSTCVRLPRRTGTGPAPERGHQTWLWKSPSMEVFIGKSAISIINGGSSRHWKNAPAWSSSSRSRHSCFRAWKGVVTRHVRLHDFDP